MTTKQETKFEIIHEFFWHRLDNSEFARFNSDNFPGLVLASTYSLKLAEPTAEGIELVNTTFINLLTELYGINNSDSGFDSYDELIGDIDI